MKAVLALTLVLLGTLSAQALPVVPVVHAGVATTSLFVDCDVGSVEGASGPDGIPDPACNWDGGGELSIVIGASDLPERTNGFRIMLRYDTGTLDAVSIDQTGALWDPDDPNPSKKDQVLELLREIDVNPGEVRLDQVLLVLGEGGTSVQGDGFFFRINFEVVAAGISALDIHDDVITNPLPVPHDTLDGSFVACSGTDLQADFGFSPSQPFLDDVITFSATTACGTAPITFSWSFGDGSSASGNPTTHTYTAQGTYNVVLDVRDNTAVSKQVSHAVTVTATPPIASFTHPTETQVGEEATFDASASYDPDGGSIVGYAWDFGDSHQAIDTRIGHTFGSAGDFIILLTVTDDEGESASMTATVTVKALEPFKAPTSTEFPLLIVIAIVGSGGAAIVAVVLLLGRGRKAEDSRV